LAERPEVDELEQYLAMASEADFGTDLLVYWKKLDTAEKGGLPNLAKFARQHLRTPASSAGVERLFSRASRMHDDLKSVVNDETLMHQLFAACNTK